MTQAVGKNTANPSDMDPTLGSDKEQEEPIDVIPVWLSAAHFHTVELVSSMGV